MGWPRKRSEEEIMGKKKQPKITDWLKRGRSPTLKSRMDLLRKTRQQRPMKERLWRTDIGHYGGLFVEIPEEHFAQFKKSFPPKMFPRRVKETDITDPNSFSRFARQIFVQKFPESRKVKEVFFADRSKGLKFLEDVLFKGRNFVVNPYEGEP